jgi:hypothetical protein
MRRGFSRTWNVEPIPLDRPVSSLEATPTGAPKLLDGVRQAIHAKRLAIHTQRVDQSGCRDRTGYHGLLEPRPTAAQVATNPPLEDRRRMLFFLIFALWKPMVSSSHGA